jgi:hypothetical protein
MVYCAEASNRANRVVCSHNSMDCCEVSAHTVVAKNEHNVLIDSCLGNQNILYKIGLKALIFE